LEDILALEDQRDDGTGDLMRTHERWFIAINFELTVDLNRAMSLIISFATGEGIVMAADSRLTLTFPDPDFADPNNLSRILQFLSWQEIRLNMNHQTNENVTEAEKA
jgi:hypothetical protein